MALHTGAWQPRACSVSRACVLDRQQGLTWVAPFGCRQHPQLVQGIKEVQHGGGVSRQLRLRRMERGQHRLMRQLPCLWLDDTAPIQHRHISRHGHRWTEIVSDFHAAVAVVAAAQGWQSLTSCLSFQLHFCVLLLCVVGHSMQAFLLVINTLPCLLAHPSDGAASTKAV